MFVFTSYIVLVIVFGVLLLSVRLVLGNRFLTSRNKNTPFECGFDPKDSARLPFSIRFFLLAVVFLIFDIEVALLFPLVLGLSLSVYRLTVIAGFGFLVILLFGLLHE